MCKVQGFSLNISASQVVNLNSMKQALRAWRDVNAYPEMVTLRTMIMRNKMTAIVYTHDAQALRCCVQQVHSQQ